MKKVYEVKKYVVASSLKEAIKVEKEFPVEEIYLTRHSADIVLEDLHYKKKEAKML